MDARTNIKGRLPSRRGAEGLARAPHGSFAAFAATSDAALHLSAIEFDLIEAGEIFKKTPYARGLKPGGRYVAKDMQEIGAIPLLMKTLLDNGHLDGDCITVTGRTIAENLKSVMWTRHDAVRSAVDAVVGTLNVKLTDAELAEHETKWRSRETNPMSGALGKYAQQIGLAVDGAVPHPGGAHEKQCYADI